MPQGPAFTTLMLTQRLTPSHSKPLTAREYWGIHQLVESLSACDGIDAIRELLLSSTSPLTPERVHDLLQASTAVAVELGQLEQAGIKVLTPWDESWPSRLTARLGTASPVLLFACGALELLSADGLGAVGSREVSAPAAERAANIGRIASAKGLPLVSGNARGVDQIAMGSSLSSGGSAVGVLADKMQGALARSEVRSLLARGDLCLVSPYNPDAPFSAGNAMGRNKIIYGLSKATIVVTCDLGHGGTWAGANESIRRGFGRVLVERFDGEGPGNAALAELGAWELRGPGDLEEVLKREAPTPAGVLYDQPVEDDQLSLFNLD